MSEDDPDEDIGEVAAELSKAMRELRDDLDHEPPRGPGGLPRPPSPREVMRFADEVAIPATIAILEANIRILEAIQRAIHIADREKEVRDRSREARSRAGDLSEGTIKRLDKALSDLQRVVDEGALPDNEAARDVLNEARTLRDRLDDRVREATETADRAREESRTIDIEPEDDDEEDESAGQASEGNGGDDGDDDGSADDEDDPDPQIDVDSELESIKQQYGDDEEQGGSDEDEDRSDEDGPEEGAAQSGY